jgi:hypothetical protein
MRLQGRELLALLACLVGKRIPWECSVRVCVRVCGLSILRAGDKFRVGQGRSGSSVQGPGFMGVAWRARRWKGMSE